MSTKIFNSSCRFQKVLYVQCQKWKVLVNSQYPSAPWAVKRQRRKTLHVWADGSQFIHFWRRQINCRARLWTKFPSSTWHLQILVAQKPPKTAQNPKLVSRKFSLKWFCAIIKTSKIVRRKFIMLLYIWLHYPPKNLSFG